MSTNEANMQPIKFNALLQQCSKTSILNFTISTMYFDDAKNNFRLFNTTATFTKDFIYIDDYKYPIFTLLHRTFDY